MASLKPFLDLETDGGNKSCLVCDKNISKNQRSAELTQSGWSKFKDDAKTWSTINVPLSDSCHNYTEVYERVKTSDTAFGSVHKNCRNIHGCQSDRYLKRFGATNLRILESVTEADAQATQPCDSIRERFARNVSCPKRLCFICREKREVDDNWYREGGLVRCSTDVVAERLRDRKNLYLNDPTHRFYDAAMRLEILLSGAAYDIFAIDVYYHQSCYIKFALSPLIQITQSDVTQVREKDVIQTFYLKIRTRIIRDKCAFLLNELLEDLKILSDEERLSTPPICHTSSLRRKLTEEFEEEISFFPKGRHLIIHASDVNPCEYVVAALHGRGLRDEDIARSFGRMIRRNTQNRTENEKRLPLTPEELLDMLDHGPMQPLYNAIYYTMHDSAKINEFGYATTSSHLQAVKIWSLASDWESLITRAPSPKQTVLGLLIHRMTGSREIANILHKNNHAISYNDIRLQNRAWSRLVSSRQHMLSNMRKGVCTHSTIDNNDGKQDTLTGSGTTYDTNKTLFQLSTEVEKATIPLIGTQIQRELDIFDGLEDTHLSVTSYFVGKVVGPPTSFEGLYVDDGHSVDELELCFCRDVAWSAAGSLPQLFRDEELPLLGS